MAEDIIDKILSLVRENDKLKLENDNLRAMSVNANKFYSSILSVDMVAALHNVSKPLVRKYVHMGLIEKHPLSTEGKILIRASDALTMDFKELKEHAKILKSQK